MIQKEVYGFWTILEKGIIKYTKSGRPIEYWLCKCQCGLEKETLKCNITASKSKECTKCAANRKNPPLKNGDIFAEKYELIAQLESKKYVKNNHNSTHRVYLIQCNECHEKLEVDGQALLKNKYHKCNCDNEQFAGNFANKLPRRRSDLSILLEETHLTYYWLGFLFADGSFSKLDRLYFSLSIKDKEQIYKFKEFINYYGEYRFGKNKNGKIVSIGISSQDQIKVKYLKEKFSISNRKTYEPCNLKNIPEEFFLSWVVGFIDGDGSINYQTGRKDCFIKIKLHSSWLENLQFISNFIAEKLSLIPNVARINAKGYANVNFTHYKIPIFLKKHAIQHKLPMMARKWDRIDLNFVSRYDIIKRKDK